MANEVYKDDANLISLWLFEGNGDDYKNNNDLAPGAAPDYPADAQEGLQSADFTPTDWLTVANTDGNIEGDTDWSCCFWWKGDGEAAQETIFYVLEDEGDGIEIVKITPGNELQVSNIVGWAWKTQASASAMSQDGTTWQHWAITFDANGGTGGTTGLFNIYLNGNTTPDASGDADPGGAIAVNETLYVGASDDQSAPADGHLDELAFFDRILTANEVNNIYTNGIQDLTIAPTAVFSGPLVGPFGGPIQ